jgi:hypothetical protein
MVVLADDAPPILVAVNVPSAATLPTAVLETDHAPPAGELLNADVVSEQTTTEPAIAEGVVFTVTIAVTAHPVFAV